MLSIGDKIPQFSLPNAKGEIFHSDSIIGRQPVVLYFYPKDFTPGCAKEAIRFRDLYEKFKALGAEIIGVSTDSVDSHKKFVEHYGLPFILLSDREQKLRQKFGIKKQLFNLIPGRETFVIDQKGILRSKFRELKAIEHPVKALETIQNLYERK